MKKVSNLSKIITNYHKDFKHNYLGIILKDVNIITLTDSDILRRYDIAIYKNKIIKIDKKIDNPRSDFIEIYKNDKYVIPMLSDMGVELKTEIDPLMFLSHGISTIRVLNGNKQNLLLKKQINNNEKLGSKIYINSPLYNDKVVKSGLDCIEKVSMNKEKGYDFSYIDKNLNEKFYETICRESKKLKIPVTGYIPGNYDLIEAIKNGVSTIEHLFHYFSNSRGFYEETFHKRYGVFLCPFLNIIQKSEESYSNKYDIYHSYNRKISDIREKVEFYPKDKLLSKLKDLTCNGVQLLIASNSGYDDILQNDGLYKEINKLRGIGFSNFDILSILCLNSHKFLGDLYYRGTIEEKKMAELLVLDENPLVDINNIKKIDSFVYNGHYVDSEIKKYFIEYLQSFKQKNHLIYS